MVAEKKLCIKRAPLVLKPRDGFLLSLTAFSIIAGCGNSRLNRVNLRSAGQNDGSSSNSTAEVAKAIDNGSSQEPEAVSRDIATAPSPANPNSVIPSQSPSPSQSPALPVSSPTPIPPIPLPPPDGNAAHEPLLHASDFQYVGGFRVPNYYNSNGGFSYGGTAIAYNASKDSIFLVSGGRSIAEISNVPPVDSQNLSSLPTATVLQPWAPLPALPNPLVGATDGEPIGGLMVFNGKLIGTMYAYYSGASIQATSHFVLDSLDLSKANVTGLFPLSGAPARAVSGYMSSIPAEWQGSLGSAYLTGQSNLCLIANGAMGPAAYGFDPTQLGQPGASAQPYLFTNDLGIYDSGVNPLQNGDAQVSGIVFVPGTRTVLFLGRSCLSYVGYGNGADYGDTYAPGKGPTCLDGRLGYQAWAYDANDLVAVKNGTKTPGSLRPYDIWNFNLPFPGSYELGGVAYDSKTGHVIVSALNADHEIPLSSMPVFAAFKVGVPQQTPIQPEVGAIAFYPYCDYSQPANTPNGCSKLSTVSFAYPQFGEAVKKGDQGVGWALNVYATASGATITGVDFYADQMDPDHMLGHGASSDSVAGGSIKDGEHNWTLTFSTGQLTAGSHQLIAVATDSNGNKSLLRNRNFTVSP